MNFKKISILIFILLFLAISIFYNYEKILFSRPAFIHLHRQTDCLSFTWNYYKYNNNFFEPQVHQKTGKDNAGKNAAEFPVIYYMVAQLWKIFGYHEWIYRFVIVVILFAGLLALYKITYTILNDLFWSLMIPLWLFSSPILIYYGNNFLTDVPALSLSLISWYFFMKFFNQKKTYNLILFFVFSCFAMLLKITSGISFVAISLLFLIDFLRQFNGKKKLLFPKKSFVHYLLFFIVGIIVFSWYFYAIQYNKIHQGNLFQTGIVPIWNLTKAEINNVLRILLDHQLNNYFYLPGLITIVSMFVFNLVTAKNQNYFLISLNITFLILILCGMMLWFDAYREHDYHLVNFLVFVPITSIAFFHFLKKYYHDIFTSKKLKIPFLLLILLCIYYGKVKTDAKYKSVFDKEHQYSALLTRWEVNYYKYMNWYYYSHNKSYETITPYLRSIGIQETDLVYSLPDPTPNSSLYFMQQRGITLNSEKGIDVLSNMYIFQNLHIKYLTLSDTSLLKDQTMKMLFKNPFGKFNNILIYKCPDMNKITKTKIFCSAENTVNDSILCSDGNIKISGTPLRVNDKAFSGNYSILLHDYKQFGFQTSFQNLKPNQIILASAWRYCNTETRAGFCFTTDDPEMFYEFNFDNIVAKENQWEKIVFGVVIPEKLEQKNIHFYVYNPDKEKKVYFDDLELIVFDLNE